MAGLSAAAGKGEADRRRDAEAGKRKKKEEEGPDRSADWWAGGRPWSPLRLFLAHLKAAKGGLNYATRSKGASNLFPAT